ncbi:MAG: phosphoribosylanthranilate isomerase [Gemmatimonadaceae bacterium]
MTGIKFCGITRAADARVGAQLGARYLGVIFAGGPRAITPAQAARALVPVTGGGEESATDAMPVRRVQRVGVFSDQTPAAIARIAEELSLDVVQLHGTPSADRIGAVRRHFHGAVWVVIRVDPRGSRGGDGSALVAASGPIFAEADAVLLDTFAPDLAGGSGLVSDWSALRAPLEKVRRDARVVLAGGLTPENVARAIELLSPDVVDVSSGVEVAPGIKDAARMRAFVEAVVAAPDNLRERAADGS